LQKIELEKALNFYGYNTRGKEKAAKALGVGIASLYRMLKKYKLYH